MSFLGNLFSEVHKSTRVYEVNVPLSSKVKTALMKVANEREITLKEVLRAGVGLYLLLDEADQESKKAEGKKILISPSLLLRRIRITRA